jgi:hypothetical protein
MKNQLWLILLMLLLSAGCKKFLDEKPDQQLVVPSTLPDLELLLKNTNVLNAGNAAVAESFADNYYVSLTEYIGFGAEEIRQKYIWGDGCFPNSAPGSEWSRIFQQVYIANVVLEGLEKIEKTASNAAAWDEVSGAASFFRAKGWWEAMVIWTAPYDSLAAASQLGIPLHRNAEFEKALPRASLQETMTAIIEDFSTAASLCADQVVNNTNPSKAAAQAMLSRVYLYMRQYQQAAAAALACLQSRSTLMNYNDYSSTATYPFPFTNPENILVANALTDVPAFYSKADVDSNLYRSYEDNDLRKILYFTLTNTGNRRFRGNYSGSGQAFLGPAVDEIMLNYAEALTRLGQPGKALETMNALLVTRYKKNTYQPKAGLDQQATLDWVLQERRKELLFRCLRWADLKRLNFEDRYKTTIIRKIPTGEVRLIPGDKRYAAVIPEEAVVFGGLEQNPR